MLNARTAQRQAVPPLLLVGEKPQHLIPSQIGVQSPNVSERDSFKTTSIEGERTFESEGGSLSDLLVNPLPATVWHQARIWGDAQAKSPAWRNLLLPPRWEAAEAGSCGRGICWARDGEPGGRV